MTNNLKIIIILSIFVSILTGYFCFSSPSFVKNQAISNNNNEDKKVTENKSEDKNKEKEEVFSKPSRINLRLIIFIFIIIFIIVVIIFTIIKLIIKNKENKENKKKFKFNEESRKDFAKENFCPTFFSINPEILLNTKLDNTKYFFENLKKLIFQDKENLTDMEENIYMVNIILGANKKDKSAYFEKNNYDRYICTLFLKDILTEISDFAFFCENVKKSKAIEAKYGEEFDSYLCAYLLYYLSETINKEVNFSNKKEIKTDTIQTIFTFTFSNLKIPNIYNINYYIISKILKKLLNDKPIENVKF